MKSTKEKLRELRFALSLSQREFGERVNVTRGAINAYEQGQNIPKVVLESIIQNIGIEREYFESDMSAQEALKRSETLTKANSASCLVFDGLQNFALNNGTIKFILPYLAIEGIFRSMATKSHSLIKVHGLEAEAIAKDGDILVVTDEMPNIGNFVILNFVDRATIAKCSLIRDSTKGYKIGEVEISEEEHHKVLGVIKSVISTTAL